MEEINRLHDIADDIGSTSWGYELASALHNIAAGIEEKVDEMRHVLDADGVEVHKSDEVWSTTGEFDGKRTVSSVHIDPDEPPYAMFEERQKPYSCLCCHLTHQRPVLDADGLLIKEVDMVYSKETGGRFEVTGFTNDGFVICWDMDKCESDIEILPSDLTHTKPKPSDTWKRIEQDAECTVTEYNERRGTIFTTKRQVARDLVRRCEEVARKENNNE